MQQYKINKNYNIIPYVLPNYSTVLEGYNLLTQATPNQVPPNVQVNLEKIFRFYQLKTKEFKYLKYFLILLM